MFMIETNELTQADLDSDNYVVRTKWGRKIDDNQNVNRPITADGRPGDRLWLGRGYPTADA